MPVHIGGHLPLPIGGGAVQVAPSDVDLVIDNVPLWLAISQQATYQRQTADFQRQQVDQQPEAGEQTLTSWWLRSQLSLQLGAGLDYLDTDARPDGADRLRFKTSRGVDVWTPGSVSRLNGSLLARSTPAGERVWVETALVGSTSYLLVARDSAVETFDGTAWVSQPVAGLGAFCTDGSNAYWATLDGVYRAPIGNLASAVRVWALPNTPAPLALGWVKQRLMLGVGPAVYELGTATPPLPATLPKVLYTNPTAEWRWTGFADAPTGIMASGYAGLSSSIFKFELTTVADAPILGPGISLLSMPAGERVQTMLSYLGGLVAIGTNRGLRISAFDSYYGTISLGPLSVDKVSVSSLGGYDRFVFAGATVDGEACLLRVDLSAPLDQQGHYAWAPDLVGSSPLAGTITAIGFREDGRKWWALADTGVLEEQPGPDLLAEAWVQTARVRVGTVQNKHFSYATVRGQGGMIRVERQLAGGDFLQVYEAAPNQRFGLRGTPAEWLALRIHLVGDTVLSGYQIQALPAGDRQRIVQFPVRLSNYEKTRSGQRVGYDGWARQRLAQLEALDNDGSEITVNAPALFPDAVRGVIEKLQYVQTHDPGDRGEGTGGVLLLVVRVTS